MWFDKTLLHAFAGSMVLLVLASVVAEALARRGKSDAETIRNLKARIASWYGIVVILAIALATGRIGACILFALVSFTALSEYVTLLKSSRYDHRALVTSFFVIAPLQYLLVACGWLGLFSILIPVYAFLYIPTSLVLKGDYQRFLERVATIQWGLMVCVYCVSYAPALFLLKLRVPHEAGPRLLIFLIVVVELSDILQYTFGKLFGKRKLSPNISPNKTWAGLVGGVLGAGVIGAALHALTPYAPWAAFGVAVLLALLGTAGGLTMSAVKRDKGVKDFAAVLPGHGGILDRIDSLCFAAPVLYHLTNYFFGV